MSDWSVLGSVIGSVIGTAVAGPLGMPVGLVAGGLLAADDTPTPLSPHKPDPYPGTTPGNPAFPGGPLSPTPTPPPPAPPRPDADGSGAAADAANADSHAVQQILDHLEELDKSAAATDRAVEEARAEARVLLAGLQHDVEAKVAELGPRLNSPDGQKELRDFLAERITSAKGALDKVMADAEARARETRDRTRHYLDAANQGGDGTGGSGGTEPTGSSGDASGAGGPGAAVGGADQGTSPASAAPAAPPAAPATPFGQGLMPGAGMMPGGMALPSMPTFGGAGVPGGFGGGDPLGGLSGLSGSSDGAPHAAGPEFRDDTGQSDHSDQRPADPVPHDGADHPSATDAGPDDTAKDTGTEAAAAHQADPAADDHTGGDVPTGAHSTTIALPDGTNVEARTTQGATAVTAALHGGTVADAWQQAGVTVPPPGTPVTAPIPPTQLMAGDVGVWKDHLVMALGSGKVLVSGQVQPLSSVGSGPDFLGWMDPSAARPGGPPATRVTPPTPPAS